MAVDDARLRALTAEVDLDAVRTAAEGVVAACLEPVGAGPRERWAGAPVWDVDRTAEHRGSAVTRTRRDHDRS